MQLTNKLWDDLRKLMDQSIKNSQLFVADCLIQSLGNKDLVYSYLPSVGVSHGDLHRLIAQSTMGLSDFFTDLYFEVLENIQNNVRMVHADQTAKISQVYFHERFGWVLVSELGKAYLGKMSLPRECEVKIGLMSYFSGNSIIVGSHKEALLEIGSFSSIGDGAYIVSQDYSHPIDYPSTYNFWGNRRILSENLQFDKSSEPCRIRFHSVQIGSDVWVGRDVTIKNGITLGHGCVVGMCSLVTKDCAPYGIYGGVPARLIRYRFSEDVIAEMLEMKWWKWPIEKIRANRDFFNTKLKENERAVFPATSND
jgi:acetyltransferase-like isoleucine patch superfamily enzyme